MFRVIVIRELMFDQIMAVIVIKGQCCIIAGIWEGNREHKPEYVYQVLKFEHDTREEAMEYYNICCENIEKFNHDENKRLRPMDEWELERWSKEFKEIQLLKIH